MHKMIRKVGSLTQKKQKKKMRNRKFKQPFLEFINKTKEAILNCGISNFPLFTSSEVSVLSLLNDRNFIYNLDPYN